MKLRSNRTGLQPTNSEGGWRWCGGLLGEIGGQGGEGEEEDNEGDWCGQPAVNMDDDEGGGRRSRNGDWPGDNYAVAERGATEETERGESRGCGKIGGAETLGTKHEEKLASE